MPVAIGPAMDKEIRSNNGPDTLCKESNDVMKKWEKLDRMPTWRNGKNALEVWLSGDYQSISATSESRLSSSKVFDENVLYSDVVRDLDSAKTKFTLWDSTNNCLDLNADRDQFIERRFANVEASKCKTAFDIKATLKGVLRRSPH